MPASRNNPANRNQATRPDATYIKYVKKAHMYCKTTFVKGVQKTEWFMTQEEAKA